MASSRDLVLDAATTNTPPKRSKKKKRTGKQSKKKLHIFFYGRALVISKYKEMEEPWECTSCGTFINWCHIFKGFPIQISPDSKQGQFGSCKWPFFKDRCAEEP
jgi:hypothetical protein